MPHTLAPTGAPRRNSAMLSLASRRKTVLAVAIWPEDDRSLKAVFGQYGGQLNAAQRREPAGRRRNGVARSLGGEGAGH